jgi:hypothetical protein
MTTRFLISYKMKVNFGFNNNLMECEKGRIGIQDAIQALSDSAG